MPAADPPVRPKRVFLSYAWEDEEYKVWVRRLATQLRNDGVDARLDVWHLKTSVTGFMSSEIRQADWIVVLCSPKYKAKADALEDGQPPSGAGWESRLLSTAMFVQNQKNILAILARGRWLESAPLFLQDFPCVDLSNPATLEAGYRDLLRRIYGTEEKAPPLGVPKPTEVPPVLPLLTTRPALPAPSGQPASSPSLPAPPPKPNLWWKVAVGVMLASLAAVWLVQSDCWSCRREAAELVEVLQKSDTKTGDHIRGLWKLVAAQDCVRSRVLDTAFDSELRGRNFSQRSEGILQAAIGLSSQRRDQVLAPVIKEHCRADDLTQTETIHLENCLKLIQASRPEDWKVERHAVALELFQRGGSAAFAELAPDAKTGAVEATIERLKKSKATDFLIELNGLLAMKPSLSSTQAGILFYQLLTQVDLGEEVVTLRQLWQAMDLTARANQQKPLTAIIERQFGKLVPSALGVRLETLKRLSLYREFFTGDQKTRFEDELLAVTAEFGKPSDYTSYLRQLFAVEGKLPALAADLSVTTRGQLARQLQALVQGQKEPYQLKLAAEALLALQSPEAVRPLLEPALIAALRSHPEVLPTLAPVLSELLDSAPSRALLASVGQTTRTLLSTPASEGDLEESLKGLAPLADQLSDKDKVDLVDMVRKRKGDSLVGQAALARALRALNLPQAAARLLIDDMLLALSTLRTAGPEGNQILTPGVQSVLLDTLGGLAPAMTSEQALESWKLAMTVFSVTRDTKSFAVLDYAPLLGKLAERFGAFSPQRGRALRCFLATFRMTANPPCGVAEPLLINPRAEPEELDLLKWPSCSARDREALLKRLRELSGLRPEGDLWSFVAWAENEKLSPERPPRFPDWDPRARAPQECE